MIRKIHAIKNTDWTDGPGYSTIETRLALLPFPNLPTKRCTMATILLIGLEATIADELSRVLRQLGQSVQCAAQGSGADGPGDIQLIFAPQADLIGAQRSHPGVPVIVVSRVPEVSAWLQALEQGAADYCGAPFEARQVRWALNSSLAPANRIAA